MATADNANLEKEIFEQALGIGSAEERLSYLKGACGEDVALLARIQALLHADEEGEEFMPEEPRDQATAPLITQKSGDRIGRYRLIKDIGEGGCGVVYEAEQEKPVRRRVALKVIKLGMDTKSVIARFEGERQALAMMDHPNIAKVLDAGATETGRPYFVMELIPGIKITDYCDQNAVSTPVRLAVFVQVCAAVQHAHQKGIIHRDLKPSNILVATNDGVAVPKVIDFGIAKATQGRLTDKTLFTAIDQFLGTPAYMSPEQATMTGQDIDTRSDIYSLGVLLYELLTGRPPFESMELLSVGLDEMLRIIREQEPQRPSTRLKRQETSTKSQIANRKSQIDSDLDWIAMKCLEKDRTRRYETANDLLLDILRHLGNEPVTACPPSKFYRFQKLVRRNKRVFASVAAVASVFVVGAVISAWEAVRAQTEAATSRQIAHFLQDTFKAVAPSVAQGRDTAMLRDLMDRAAERVGKELRDQPVAEAEMRATIGEVYVELGEYGKADAMHREALKLATKSYGRVHPEVASALDNVSVVLYRQGKAAEAEALERKVLAMRIKTLGKDHPRVAMSLINLGEFLRAEGKLADAEIVGRQALAASQKAFGSGNENVINALNNLGCVLRDEGKLAEVEGTAREVLAAERMLFGTNHPNFRTSLNNLAKTLADEGKTREAETTFREALAVRIKVLGAQHPDVAQTLDSLAGTLQDQGHLADAEGMYRQSLAIREKALGTEHPDVALSLNNLADLLDDESKTAEAEGMQRKALAMQRKLLGNQNLDVARSLYQLAGLIRSQRRSPETEALLREALATQQKLIGSDHPALALTVEQLARAVSERGKLDEAETLFRECLRIREKSMPDDWLTFSARSGLGENLLDRKKYAEAELLLISAYNGLHERQDKIPPYNKPVLKKAVERLIRLYEQTGRSDQASELKQKLAAGDKLAVPEPGKTEARPK